MSLTSKKASGILCHFTSLPTSYGVGDFGPVAYQFVDKLASAKQSYWQILPIGNTGGTGCPYATDSAFGCADFLISPEMLIKDYSLDQNAFDTFHQGERDRVDFAQIKKDKEAILEAVYKVFTPAEDYKAFLETEKTWLNPYSLFRTLEETRGKNWREWPRFEQAEHSLSAAEKERVAFHKFVQFNCFKQLSALKKYANLKNIKLIGDLPIFVSYSSMDVWKDPAQFMLNRETLAIEIETGAAPDGFSAVGQKWGTPIYDWEFQRKNKYQWWNERLAFLKRYMDVVRIDHFRGFCATWVSKISEPDASGGFWVEGPRADLFKSLLESPEIIAEDLGHITPDVDALRDQFNFPGMKIIQFMLGDETNPHKMMNYNDNSVAFSGTHDNDTLMGWFNGLSPEERGYVESELKIKNPDVWGILEVLMSAKSNLVIIQIQDLLSLGTEARFNYPGTVDDMNWTWKLTTAQLNQVNWNKLGELTQNAKRSF